MNSKFKKLALAVVTLSGLSLMGLGIASAPAEARVICDRDGDDCRQVPGWYERERHDVICDEDGDDCRRVGGWHDRDDYWRWRRHEWEERQEGWDTRTSWGAPYYRSYQPTYGGSVWFGN